MSDVPWSSDTPVSRPSPLEVELQKEVRIHMGGFVFTRKGMRHEITQVEVEEEFTPIYAPPDPGD